MLTKLYKAFLFTKFTLTIITELFFLYMFSKIGKMCHRYLVLLYFRYILNIHLMRLLLYTMATLIATCLLLHIGLNVDFLYNVYTEQDCSNIYQLLLKVFFCLFQFGCQAQSLLLLAIIDYLASDSTMPENAQAADLETKYDLTEDSMDWSLSKLAGGGRSPGGRRSPGGQQNGGNSPQ